MTRVLFIGTECLGAAIALRLLEAIPAQEFEVLGVDEYAAIEKERCLQITARVQMTMHAELPRIALRNAETFKGKRIAQWKTERRGR